MKELQQLTHRKVQLTNDIEAQMKTEAFPIKKKKPVTRIYNGESKTRIDDSDEEFGDPTVSLLEEDEAHNPKLYFVDGVTPVDEL